MSALRTFLRLLPALRPEWRGMLRSYLVGTSSGLALAALTVATAWAVGHAVVEGTLPGPAWWTLAAGLILARAGLTWHEMDVSHALAYRVLARLRTALFDAFGRSVPARRREHSGRTAAIVMDDVERLEFFYAHTTAQLGAAATVFLGSLVVSAVLSPPAAGVLLAGAAAVVALSGLRARAARAVSAAEQRERDVLATLVVDSLGALREVLGYGLASRVVDDVDRATGRVSVLARRGASLAQSVTAVRELAVTVVVVAVVAASWSSARLPPAQLPALVALALAGIAAVADAVSTASRLHPLVASAHRVAETIDRAALTPSRVDPLPVPPGPLGLRLRDVSFSYADRPAALEGCSLDVAPGERVGLAGPSGAGKSTVVALAARLWDPDAGVVELVALDGTSVPLHEVDDAQLRAAVAVVDQEATLFHGTVRDNLLRGTEDRSDAELTVALRAVGADGWVDLDDDLGESGVRLSGGQRARVCMARALVRRPRVLLVDEVTASLDPASEEAIGRVLTDFAGTVLCVSHREATLQRFDRVITLGSVSTRQESGPSPWV